MADMAKAIKNHETDNVATVFDVVKAGADVKVFDKKGNTFVMKVSNDIPYGHKVALVAIAVGEQVTKYGEEIGVATKAIQPGDHVHVHNIDSIRGRGDWSAKGAK
ncbi:MAG TPA: UxaA family hydrolase [Spirochaetales bacterium]|nr:UxaA family hydrolase [Spirochaetales bacterium]